MAESSVDSFLDSTSVSFAGVGAWGRGGLNGSFGDFYPDRSPLEDDIWFKAFAIVSYSLVFIVSVFGNLLVIVVILCHKQMRSAVNFFLGNLAVADLCVGIFCVLPALFKYISQYWWLGRVICKMHNFVQCVNYTCSIIILTVISVERYIIISHPLWNRCFSGGWRVRSTVVCLVWLASIAYSIPILVTFDLRAVSVSSNHTLYFCSRSNYLIRYETYAMVDLTLLYALPLILMTFVYVRISVVLWRSSKIDARSRSASGEVGPPPPPAPQSLTSWRCRGPRGLIWCGRRCRGGSLEERGQSPWQESIALKADPPDEGHVRTSDPSGGGAKVFSHLRDGGLHHDWTIELPMRKMEPCVETTTNRHSKDASSSSSSSSSSTVTPPARDTSKTAAPAICQPYQLRRLRTLQKPLSLPSEWNQMKKNNPNSRPQQGRPVLTTVLNNGRLRHTVVSTTTASTSTGSDCRTPSKVPLAMLRRRRVIRLLIAVIVSFAVCTLPNHVRIHYYIWTPNLVVSYAQMYVPPVTMLLFYMNSAVNPILYAFISRKFRRAVVTLDWRFLWRKLTRGESASSERYTLN